MKMRFKFRPRLLPVGLAIAMVAPLGAAQASVQGIDEGNFEVDADNEITNVYPTVPPSGNLEDANGYIVIDAKEEVVAPGIDVYQEGYRQGPVFFAGCIMAKKIP